ncbi:hypothetical protein CNR22_09465 [Sphingobacteriaceae bacterium]|nr:hypothetical protein CNR22_09465 [Sphingobacteriaceae bacterium]
MKLTSAPDIELNPSELDVFYSTYFRYYNTLEKVYRQRFVERCLMFISEKVISGADDFKPDNRVKALVAASAVQLTLGLEVWQLNYFEEIQLHPSNFDNAKGDLKFNGETNLQGYIKLSWKSFIRGYEINDDNMNLGLHEFSHALRFNSIKGHEQDYFVDNYFNKWIACASDAFNDIRNKKETIFRSYGGTNINEFLSVCIEHYFESPEEIKENYPTLYYATGILLNQSLKATKTQIGIRKEFFAAQNAFLPGFHKLETKTSFFKHWSSKLWGFVVAVLVYNMVGGKIVDPITLALFVMAVIIYTWFDYNAANITFDLKTIVFKRGFIFFKNRKTWTIPVSQFVSFRISGEEWIITYYKDSDDFFHEETIYPPNGVNETFLTDCKQNKIAVLR